MAYYLTMSYFLFLKLLQYLIHQLFWPRKKKRDRQRSYLKQMYIFFKSSSELVYITSVGNAHIWNKCISFFATLIFRFEFISFFTTSRFRFGFIWLSSPSPDRRNVNKLWRRFLKNRNIVRYQLWSVYKMFSF